MTTDIDIETRIGKILTDQLQSVLPANRESVTMDAIPAWDSLAQVQIVVAIESEFGIEADTTLIEAQTLVSLVEIVSLKLQASAVQRVGHNQCSACK